MSLGARRAAGGGWTEEEEGSSPWEEGWKERERWRGVTIGDKT